MTTSSDGGLHAAAKRICSDAFGVAVRLGPAQPVRDWDGRALVRRCEVLNQADHLPASVVLKRFNLGGAHGVDEWASLDFVGNLVLDSNPAPAFYGGDQVLSLIVTEDLGDVRSRGLSRTLQMDNRERAAQLLEELARNLGRLHAVSFGLEDRYNIRRRSLSADQVDAFHQIFRVQTSLRQFEDNVGTVGVDPSPGARRDLAMVQT